MSRSLILKEKVCSVLAVCKHGAFFHNPCDLSYSEQPQPNLRDMKVYECELYRYSVSIFCVSVSLKSQLRVHVS